MCGDKQSTQKTCNIGTLLQLTMPTCILSMIMTHLPNVSLTKQQQNVNTVPHQQVEFM